MSVSAGINRTHVGDQPVAFVDVRNDLGVVFTPTAGRLLIAKPGAAASVVVPWGQLVKEPGNVVGRVEYPFSTPLDTAGLWRIFWEFTGGVVGVEPFEFAVHPRSVPAPAL